MMPVQCVNINTDCYHFKWTRWQSVVCRSLTMTLYECNTPPPLEYECTVCFYFNKITNVDCFFCPIRRSSCNPSLASWMFEWNTTTSSLSVLISEGNKHLIQIHELFFFFFRIYFFLFFSICWILAAYKLIFKREVRLCPRAVMERINKLFYYI